MHILMYRWKAYNYRDIEQTFLLLGHTVDNIEQELGSYDVSPEFERVIEEKIWGTHYDMVFTVNYFRISESCVAFRLSGFSGAPSSASIRSVSTASGRYQICFTPIPRNSR